MKVKELIQELKKLDEELEVYVDSGERSHEPAQKVIVVDDKVFVEN